MKNKKIILLYIFVLCITLLSVSNGDTIVSSKLIPDSGSSSGAGSGDVIVSGTPLVNQLAIWTDATHIKGDAALTYDGTDVSLDAGLIVNESGADKDARFEGDTDTNLLFLDAGNDKVGVGTSAPNAKFEVISSGTETTSSFVMNDSTTSFGDTYNAVMMSNFDATANNWAKFSFGGKTGAPTASIASVASLISDHTNGYGNLTFWTRGAGGWDERMRIQEDGDVGIGETAPDAMLEVNEGVHINGSSGDNDTWIEGLTEPNLLYIDAGNDRVGVGTNTPDDLLHVFSGSAGVYTANGSYDEISIESSGTGGMSIGTPDADSGGIYIGSPSNVNNGILIANFDDALMSIGTAYAGHDLRFMTGNWAEVIRILDSGDVGIGESSPDAKLDIAGTLMLTEQAAADADAAGKGQFWIKSDTPNTAWFTDDAGTDHQLGAGTSASMEYGNIYTQGSSTAITVGSSSTWYQITTFTANGPDDGATADHTNDHITIGTTGDYYISFSSSFEGGAADVYEVHVEKNNGATDIDTVYISRKLSNNGDVGSASGSGIASLTAGDTIELWVQDLDAGADVTFTELSLSVVSVDAASGVPAADLTTAGIIEIATAAETTTGTDATRAVSPDGLAGSRFGEKEAQMVCFDFTTDTATGNGKGYFHIGPRLAGMNLVDVHGEVITPGTTGTTDIQVYNQTQSVDMLTTVITIDSGEGGSNTAATPPVIDTSNDDVVEDDLIRIDVDAVSTTPAKGMIVTLGFRKP